VVQVYLDGNLIKPMAVQVAQQVVDASLGQLNGAVAGARR
jgi:hypothetical protein